MTIENAVLGAQGEKVAQPKKKGRVAIWAEELEDRSVVVRSLEAGGAGEKAGLKPGDKVLKVDGKAVAGVDALVATVSGRYVGDTVTFSVQRGEETLELKVTLSE